jgi:predicted molibdopterin-dependent oxidoreductase YjgC
MEGNLRALYIIGEDILMNEPNYNLMKETLEKLDFLVVQDIFMSETAKIADLVLPAASFAEKDGTFTNAERRIQLIRKAVEPPGEALPDWEIICLISNKMGYPMKYDSASEIMDEIATLTPLYGGISHSRLGDHGLQWPCPDSDHPGTAHMHRGEFTRGKGKFFPVEHQDPSEVADDEYPFVLSTGRIIFQYCVGTMTRRTRCLEREAPENTVTINEDDGKALSLKEGQVVKIKTRRGEVTAKANLTKRIRKGVIWMPFHYHESPTNIITNDAFDPLSRIAEYKACAARIES